MLERLKEMIFGTVTTPIALVTEVQQLKMMEDKIKACTELANNFDKPDRVVPLHLSSCLYYRDRVKEDMRVFGRLGPFSNEIKAFDSLFHKDYVSRIEAVEKQERDTTEALSISRC